MVDGFGEELCLSLMAEVFSLETDGKEKTWKPLGASKKLFPINLIRRTHPQRDRIIGKRQVHVAQSFMLQIEVMAARVREHPFADPGIVVQRTTSWFVQWTDKRLGKVLGFNFVSEYDAAEFMLAAAIAFDEQQKHVLSLNPSLNDHYGGEFGLASLSMQSLNKTGHMFVRHLLSRKQSKICLGSKKKTKKWAMLEGSQLILQSKKDSKKKTVIDVEVCLVQPILSETGELENFVLALTSGDAYEIFVEDEEDMVEWMQCLLRVAIMSALETTNIAECQQILEKTIDELRFDADIETKQKQSEELNRARGYDGTDEKEFQERIEHHILRLEDLNISIFRYESYRSVLMQSSSWTVARMPEQASLLSVMSMQTKEKLSKLGCSTSVGLFLIILVRKEKEENGIVPFSRRSTSDGFFRRRKDSLVALPITAGPVPATPRTQALRRLQTLGDFIRVYDPEKSHNILKREEGMRYRDILLSTCKKRNYNYRDFILVGTETIDGVVVERALPLGALVHKRICNFRLIQKAILDITIAHARGERFGFDVDEFQEQMSWDEDDQTISELIVTYVEKGSPANMKGVGVGDTILSIQGEVVTGENVGYVQTNMIMKEQALRMRVRSERLGEAIVPTELHATVDGIISQFAISPPPRFKGDGYSNDEFDVDDLVIDAPEELVPYMCSSSSRLPTPLKRSKTFDQLTEQGSPLKFAPGERLDEKDPSFVRHVSQFIRTTDDVTRYLQNLQKETSTSTIASSTTTPQPSLDSGSLNEDDSDDEDEDDNANDDQKCEKDIGNRVEDGSGSNDSKRGTREERKRERGKRLDKMKRVNAAANMSAHEMKRQRQLQRLHGTLKEIVTTEQSFVESIVMMLSRFVHPLRQHRLLTARQELIVFSNMDEIAEFHKTFLPQLELVCASILELDVTYLFPDEVTLLTSAAMEVAKLFIRIQKELHMYARFCACQTKAADIVGNGASAIVDEWLDARNPRQEQSASFASLLIKPFQRILKYPLLLKSIDDNLPGQGEVNAIVKEALGCVKGIASHINSMKGLCDVFEEPLQKFLLKKAVEEYEQSRSLVTFSHNDRMNNSSTNSDGISSNGGVSNSISNASWQPAQNRLQRDEGADEDDLYNILHKTKLRSRNVSSSLLTSTSAATLANVHAVLMNPQTFSQALLHASTSCIVHIPVLGTHVTASSTTNSSSSTSANTVATPTSTAIVSATGGNGSLALQVSTLVSSGHGSNALWRTSSSMSMPMLSGSSSHLPLLSTHARPSSFAPNASLFDGDVHSVVLASTTDAAPFHLSPRIQNNLALSLGAYAHSHLLINKQNLLRQTLFYPKFSLYESIGSLVDHRQLTCINALDDRGKPKRVVEMMLLTFPSHLLLYELVRAAGSKGGKKKGTSIANSNPIFKMVALMPTSELSVSDSLHQGVNVSGSNTAALSWTLYLTPKKLPQWYGDGGISSNSHSNGYNSASASSHLALSSTSDSNGGNNSSSSIINNNINSNNGMEIEFGTSLSRRGSIKKFVGRGGGQDDDDGGHGDVMKSPQQRRRGSIAAVIKKSKRQQQQLLQQLQQEYGAMAVNEYNASTNKTITSFVYCFKMEYDAAKSALVNLLQKHVTSFRH
eukprot:m.62344 g.62344  ORF g.62344 m.62344 type:complete len:1611 (-) comp8028_c0_seq1:154-4986(-)